MYKHAHPGIAKCTTIFADLSLVKAGFVDESIISSSVRLLFIIAIFMPDYECLVLRRVSF